MLLVGADGLVARTVAPPKIADMVRIRTNAGGGDAQGRLLYRGEFPARAVPRGEAAPAPNDSAPIVRADFDTRAIDTVAVLSRPFDRPMLIQSRDADGRISFQMRIRPIFWTDDWTVMPDGTSRSFAATTITSTGSVLTARESHRRKCRSTGVV